MPVNRELRRAALLAAGFTLAVGGCSSGKEGGADGRPAADAARPVPTRAMVIWADTMCEATDLLTSTKASSAEDIKEIKDPPEDAFFEPSFEADNYLHSTPSSLSQLSQQLADVRPSKIAAADRFSDRLSRNVGKVAPRITKMTESTLEWSDKKKVDRAERVAELIASVKMPEPGLPAVAKKDPKLAAAYHLAPGCVPPAKPSPSPKATGPLPEADDGKDLDACKDGKCEVLVTKPADIDVGDLTLHVIVKDGTVTLQHSSPSGGKGQITLTSEGGRGTFGDAGGGGTTVKAVGVRKSRAVLRVSTS